MDSTAEIAITEVVNRRIGAIVSGKPHEIGAGFSANHFSEEMFGGRMDPLLMVDHFVMTRPTFDPHLHAGISAVTMMFEDTEGVFHNRDTLGQNIDLKAGDLYWLAAASGAAHEEKPAEGARIHALQIFVNLPGRLKKSPARSLKVEAANVPIIEGRGHRVRVVLGESGDVTGATGTPEEMTVLDGYLVLHGCFTHTLPEGWQAWVYAVSGTLTVACGGEERVIEAGMATTIDAGPSADISLKANAPAHFVLLAGKPIREAFVKHGPLVMSTAADVERTLSDYALGKFGRIPA
ncbi:pirin [Paramesorhizobium deserti]|uniref:Pirin n=1 Tax=Paramesorhizobium deserti TaxID=1494590 RepID=A0A135HVN0_9HYPH|nr:pirin-like C-terminal cupin domain-containing protein [Paramesorhizobium deserti]KXF77246.1 pirin [Paramesorhizobium deserti]